MTVVDLDSVVDRDARCSLDRADCSVDACDAGEECRPPRAVTSQRASSLRSE
jgi:hypothetical protein